MYHIVLVDQSKKCDRKSHTVTFCYSHTFPYSAQLLINTYATSARWQDTASASPASTKAMTGIMLSTLAHNTDKPGRLHTLWPVRLSSVTLQYFCARFRQQQTHQKPQQYTCCSAVHLSTVTLQHSHVCLLVTFNKVTLKCNSMKTTTHHPL